MPTYEYACKDCGEQFTIVASVENHEHAQMTCPKCQSQKVKRVFSGFSVKTGKKS